MIDKPPEGHALSLVTPMMALIGLAAAALAGKERDMARIAGGALFAAPAAYYAPPTVAAVLIERGWMASLPAGGSVDGVIGAKTIAAVRQMAPAVFTARFSAYRLKYLASLKTWPSFGRGWCNRVAANLLEGAD